MPLNWTCLVIQHISTVPHQIGIPSLWSHPLFKDNVIFINIFLLASSMWESTNETAQVFGKNPQGINLLASTVWSTSVILSQRNRA